MAARRRAEQDPDRPRLPPATTPEGRENQMVSLAVQLAEEQLRSGTASAQVISHYLKLGSTREKLEQERLARENKLLEAKIKSMESAANLEGLFQEAIDAMRSYKGDDSSDYHDPHDD